MNAAPVPPSRWHIDRTVNIAVVLGFVGTIATGTWYAASASARIEQLEKAVATSAPLVERVIRLEDKMDGLRGAIDDVKAMLRPDRPR